MASKKVEMYAKKRYELDEIKNKIKEEFDKHKFSDVEFKDEIIRESGDTKTLLLIFENWLKTSIEYENKEYQHLGSVVTNYGYSDWATTVIDASVKSMWYRFSRRDDDYCIECSEDGVQFSQMRICHMHKGDRRIRFGIYACSPEESSFKAVFSNMNITECQWLAHDGQQPDE